jgi:hypothetical protein
MPGTLKFTPKWLSRPSPGFDVFSSQAPAKLTTDTKQKDKKYIGPQRTIARRGTEVFVATGNEIRWSDLVLLKEQWEDAQTKKNGHGNGSEHNEHAGDVDDDDEIGMDEGQDAKPVPSHRVGRSDVVDFPCTDMNLLDPQSAHFSSYPTAHHLTRR